jgi:hypothetical protein
MSHPAAVNVEVAFACVERTLLSVALNFDLVLDLDWDLAQTARLGRARRSVLEPALNKRIAPKGTDNALLLIICHSDPFAAAPAARTGRNLLLAGGV